MGDFEAKLDGIFDTERRVLHCLSLFWEPFMAGELHKLLSAPGLRTPEGRKYTTKFAMLLRNSLVRKGFLRETSFYWGKGFRFADDGLKEFLTREAVREDWFEETAETIRATFGGKYFQYSGWLEKIKAAPLGRRFLFLF
jgi:hypothetical protein